MASEDYKPRGRITVVMGEVLLQLDFDGREDMVNLMAWIKERNGEHYVSYQRHAITSEVICTIQDALTPSSNINPVDLHRTANDAPICKKHKTPMVKSTKDPGGWYCKGHDGAGNYCKNFYSSKGKVRNDE